MSEALLGLLGREVGTQHPREGSLLRSVALLADMFSTYGSGLTWLRNPPKACEPGSTRYVGVYIQAEPGIAMF